MNTRKTIILVGSESLGTHICCKKKLHDTCFLALTIAAKLLAFTAKETLCLPLQQKNFLALTTEKFTPQFLANPKQHDFTTKPHPWASKRRLVL